MSNAVTPTANAPIVADPNATAQAGVGQPCHVTHPKSLQKHHDNSVHNG